MTQSSQPNFGFKSVTSTITPGLDQAVTDTDAALKKVQENPDDMGAMMELQMALGKKSTLAQLQSNIIKNILDTMNALVNNIK